MTAREYFKVVLLGETGTGKTCMIKRYFNNVYNPMEPATIGAAFESKIFNVYGKEYQMGVWDTTGQERYRAICSLYYRAAVAAIICYDVTLQRSFRQIEYWISELRRVEESCRIYLCATKCDLLGEFEANPPLSFVESFASEKNAKFFKTSSRTGENVDRIFDEILEDYVSNVLITPGSTNTIKLPTSRTIWKRRTKKCCSDR
ncbi:Rab24 GTPase-like [Nasonia vitripennis]|uniref:Uncharacterized protein n=1 Tax=Nasonia vitripennis TaxID=7425 RepID=A0A7M6UVR1_NASVI|nr:Rab24 GTPase-like [Nasonia vitripennis]